jgi:hypothetical protein
MGPFFLGTDRRTGFARAVLAGAWLLFAGAASAHAQNYAVVPDAMMLQETPLIDEIRGGFHFHNAYGGFIPSRPEWWSFDEFEDVSFEVLFTSPEIFEWIGSPRPNLGATVNLDGQESIAHLGLTWHLPIFDTPIYVEGTLGAAIHNGYLTDPPPGFKAMGCRVNFYEQVGIGANISENVTATLTYEHTSNWELCEENGGLSNFGLRVGWKF